MDGSQASAVLASALVATAPRFRKEMQSKEEAAQTAQYESTEEAMLRSSVPFFGGLSGEDSMRFV